MTKKPSPMLSTALKEAHVSGGRELRALIKLIQLAEQDILEGRVYNSEEFLLKLGIK